MIRVLLKIIGCRKKLEKQLNNLAQLYFYNYNFHMFTHCDLSVGDVASDHIQVRLHIFLNMIINVNLIEKTYQEITMSKHSFMLK